MREERGGTDRQTGRQADRQRQRERQTERRKTDADRQ